MSPYLNIMRVRAGEAETTEYGDMGDMASFRPAGYRVSIAWKAVNVLLTRQPSAPRASASALALATPMRWPCCANTTAVARRLGRKRNWRTTRHHPRLTSILAAFPLQVAKEGRRVGVGRLFFSCSTPSPPKQNEQEITKNSR